MAPEESNKYQKLTEAPGDKASAEQVERLYHRYHLAGRRAAGRRVLEVACGTGIGLTYLCAMADSVHGCDIDAANLSRARETCRGLETVKVGWGDAQALPYPDAEFDLVLLYEAIYYLPDAAKFVAEAYRVIKPDGELIICTVNPQWPSFHPSPLATCYYSARELAELLRPWFPSLMVMGAFPVDSGGAKDRVLDVVKRCAMALHLIPTTLEGRARIKRIFFGKLHELPQRLEPGAAPFQEPVALDPAAAQAGYKILYAVAGKGDDLRQERRPLATPVAAPAPTVTGGRCNDMAKRGLDILASFLGLLLLWPVFLAVAVLIKADSPGPVFYRGLRVGRGGNAFRLLKFRSMVDKADTLGGSSTPQDDVRITKVGAWLRKTKLDELPQLINVLIGDMSLVGPRPQVQWAVELYSPEEKAILALRPGITDPASIQFSNEGELLAGSDDPDRDYMEKIHPIKMRLSLDYLREHSLRGDLLLIWQTLTTILRSGEKVK